MAACSYGDALVKWTDVNVMGTYCVKGANGTFDVVGRFGCRNFSSDEPWGRPGIMAVSLKEVEAMVEALAPTDQVRLLQYLVPRVADALLADEPDPAGANRAWREFRRVGERPAAPNGQSITQAISDMRR
jgi:hypothetical protein